MSLSSMVASQIKPELLARVQIGIPWIAGGGVITKAVLDSDLRITVSQIEGSTLMEVIVERQPAQKETL